MQVKAKLNSYEKVALAITLSAPVEDWRAMLKRIEGLNGGPGNYYSWPLGGFVGCIRKMLEDLDKTHADVLIRDDQPQIETV